MHKKIIALVLLMSLLLTACGTAAAPETTAAPTTEATVQPTEAATTPAATDNLITYFSLTLSENFETTYYLNAYGYEGEDIYVEYVGEETKMGYMDPSIFEGITAAYLESGLPELVGQDVYEEGEASASMYIDFADGTSVMLGFTGNVPEAFTQGYAAMDAHFKAMVADMPEYVPQPVVMGDVEPALLDAVNAILDGSGIEALDAFSISQLPLDDTFSFAAGLTGTDGIVNAVSCAPMMMTTAYSLVIVTVEDASKAEAVAADFESTMDWRKWVCVAPSNALLAQKDNMVLCLMAADELFAQTQQGMEANGWTVTKTLENPDM